MSISPIVDAEYRLLPEDLIGLPRHVIISNVTYQGVEEMTPVLHFEGQTKRLVLSPEQVAKIIDITGTILYPQWIGVAIVLQPPKSDMDDTISIRAVDPHKRAKPMPTYVSEDRRGWVFALAAVAFLLVASMLYAVLNMPAILMGLQQLRDNWLLR